MLFTDKKTDESFSFRGPQLSAVSPMFTKTIVKFENTSSKLLHDAPILFCGVITALGFVLFITYRSFFAGHNLPLEDGNLGVLSDITTAFKVFAFIIGILSLISGILLARKGLSRLLGSKGLKRLAIPTDVIKADDLVQELMIRSKGSPCRGVAFDLENGKQSPRGQGKQREAASPAETAAATAYSENINKKAAAVAAAADDEEAQDTRSRVREISNDRTLSAQEKQKAIREVLQSHQNYIAAPRNKPNESRTCSHYQKQCSRFYFSCCDTIDPCVRCHWDRGCTIKPPKVVSICCSVCNLRQAPNEKCQNSACGIKFSTSYCPICRIWCKDEHITHCFKCELCRVGATENIFHCDPCGGCFVKRPDGLPHQCLRTPLKNQCCSVCLDLVSVSQKRIDILRCGHCVHIDCLKKSAQGSRVVPSCPTCNKCVYDPRRAKTFWDVYRKTIKETPAVMSIPIQIGDVVRSPLGLFQVEKIYKETLTEAVKVLGVYGGMPIIPADSVTAMDAARVRALSSAAVTSATAATTASSSSTTTAASSVVERVGVEVEQDDADEKPVYDCSGPVIIYPSSAPKLKSLPASHASTVAATLKDGRNIVMQIHPNNKKTIKRRRLIKMYTGHLTNWLLLSGDRDRDDRGRATDDEVVGDDGAAIDKARRDSVDGNVSGGERSNVAGVKATFRADCLIRDNLVTVYCYDCEKTGQAQFHCMGVECPHCRGYNTKLPHA